MKKVKLNLNELKVNSFETTKQKSGKGTIIGNRPETLVTCTGHTILPDCTEDQLCAEPTFLQICTTYWYPCD